MADENANTADLTIDEKLDRILKRLTALDAQGTNTTRPLLDQIVRDMTETRDALTTRLDRIEAQLRVLTHDVMNVRTDQQRLEDRMDDLERRPI